MVRTRRYNKHSTPTYYLFWTLFNYWTIVRITTGATKSGKSPVPTTKMMKTRFPATSSKAYHYNPAVMMFTIRESSESRRFIKGSCWVLYAGNRGGRRNLIIFRIIIPCPISKCETTIKLLFNCQSFLFVFEWHLFSLSLLDFILFQSGFRSLNRLHWLIAICSCGHEKSSTHACYVLSSLLIVLGSLHVFFVILMLVLCLVTWICWNYVW